MFSEKIKKDLDYLIAKSNGKIFIVRCPELYDSKREEHTTIVDVEIFKDGTYALIYIRYESIINVIEPYSVINPDKKALDEIVAYALSE